MDIILSIIQIMHSQLFEYPSYFIDLFLRIRMFAFIKHNIAWIYKVIVIDSTFSEASCNLSFWGSNAENKNEFQTILNMLNGMDRMIFDIQMMVKQISHGQFLLRDALYKNNTFVYRVLDMWNKHNIFFRTPITEIMRMCKFVWSFNALERAHTNKNSINIYTRLCVPFLKDKTHPSYLYPQIICQRCQTAQFSTFQVLQDTLSLHLQNTYTFLNTTRSRP